VSKEYGRPDLHAENSARQAMAFRVNIVTFARKAMGPGCFALARLPAPGLLLPFPPFYGPSVLESFSLLAVLIFEVHR
jgi:hypothetical protein